MSPRVRDYFDARAGTYAALYGDAGPWRRVYQHTRWYPLFRYRAIIESEINITPGMRVVDLGCGAGEDAVRFARRGALVDAIDFSPAMLEQGRARAAAQGVAVTFTEADVETWLAQTTQAYDVGLAIGLFDYATDPREWILRLGRCCRVLIATFPRLSPLQMVASARYRMLGVPARTYTREEIGTWLRDAGFGHTRVVTPFRCGHVAIASRTEGHA